MKIDSFEMLNDGRGGIKVEGIDAMEKNGVTVFVPVTKTYPIPLPANIIDNVNKLKKYLLEVTNLFPQHYFVDFVFNGKVSDTIDPATKGYLHAKHVFETTHIKKVYRKKNGYVLTGVAESAVTSRFFNINTPLIDADDGYNNFGKLQKGVEFCFELIGTFISERNFLRMDSRQYALQLFGENSEEMERINTLNDAEVDDIMLHNLESKGYLVVNMNEALPPAGDHNMADEAIAEHEVMESINVTEDPGTGRRIRKPKGDAAAKD